jgi:trimethylamine--corrinoid protein Co-methyltransferase
MLLNTKKPIIVTGHGKNDMMTMIDMAAVALGGSDEVKRRPPLILYTEPLSPLVHTEMGVTKGLVCCDYGIPIIYIGSPMMGVSGPATVEGTLVQTVAESLAGLVFFKKTTWDKVGLRGMRPLADMSTSIFSYGAPELNILNGHCRYGSLQASFFCIAGLI